MPLYVGQMQIYQVGWVTCRRYTHAVQGQNGGCSTTQNEGCSTTRGINIQPPSPTHFFGTGLKKTFWWPNRNHSFQKSVIKTFSLTIQPLYCITIHCFNWQRELLRHHGVESKLFLECQGLIQTITCRAFSFWESPELFPGVVRGGFKTYWSFSSLFLLMKSYEETY